MKKGADAPLVNTAMAGQTTAPVPLVAPPPVALTKVTFVGNLSCTVTLVAVAGPLLVSVTVKVIVSPTFGLDLSTLLVT